MSDQIQHSEQLRKLMVFTDRVFDAALSQPRPKPADDDDAAMSGPWTRELPGVKQYIPSLRKFADDGCLVKLQHGFVGEVICGFAGQPIAGPKSLRVNLQVEIFGEKLQPGFSAPYPTEQLMRLCHGEWATFGAGQVKFAQDLLLPTVTPHGADGVRIAWPVAPEMRVSIWRERRPLLRLLGRWVRSLSKTSLAEILVTPERIDVEATGLVDYAIPGLLLV